MLAWWDGVELWLVRLWFPIQFAVVMAVVLPSCWSAAWLMERAWGRGGRLEDAVPPDGVGSQDVPGGAGVPQTERVACADGPT